ASLALDASALGGRVVGGLQAHAVAQHVLERRGAVVLLQKVAKRFLGEFLDRFHSVERQLMQSVPGLGIELDAPTHRAWGPLRHQPLALRLVAAEGCDACGAARLAGAGLALRLAPWSASTLRRSASIRLTTLASRAGAFSTLAGRPACLERISSIIAFS